MNTNIILKKMMVNTSKYQRRGLASNLSVNIENCYPISNPEMTKENKNNLFIYLDKTFRILGFLKGYEIIKQYNDKYAVYTEYPKNRKNLLANAEYVLMFTPEMRTFKIKPKTKSKNEQPSIRERLHEYKANKYKNITNEQMQEIINSIIFKLNEDLFNNTLSDKLINVVGYKRNTLDLLRDFTGIIQHYMWKQSEIDREVKYRTSIGQEFKESDCWSYKDYIKSKNEILDWKKAIC